MIGLGVIALIRTVEAMRVGPADQDVAYARIAALFAKP